MSAIWEVLLPCYGFQQLRALKDRLRGSEGTSVSAQPFLVNDSLPHRVTWLLVCRRVVHTVLC